MVCKSNAFNGTLIKNKKWMNFSENVTFSAEEYFEPQHTSPGDPQMDCNNLYMSLLGQLTNKKRFTQLARAGRTKA